jgi:hypothetical protein
MGIDRQIVGTSASSHRFRKRLLALVALVAALSVTGAAVAYFTGQAGSATGQASVGGNGAWTVTFTGTSGTMYPGAGSSMLNYQVQNGGSGNQSLQSVTATVVADGSGNVEQNGVSKSGCLASWFTATNNGPSGMPLDLGPGATTTGSVTVTMSDSGTNQNVCENVTPDVKVSAS